MADDRPLSLKSFCCCKKKKWILDSQTSDRGETAMRQTCCLGWKLTVPAWVNPEQSLLQCHTSAVVGGSSVSLWYVCTMYYYVCTTGSGSGKIISHMMTRSRYTIVICLWYSMPCSSMVGQLKIANILCLPYT